MEADADNDIMRKWPISQSGKNYSAPKHDEDAASIVWTDFVGSQPAGRRSNLFLQTHDFWDKKEISIRSKNDKIIFLTYWPLSDVVIQLSNLNRHFWCSVYSLTQSKVGSGFEPMTKRSQGSVVGQVVSVLAFYSDDPSSNHAEVNNFPLKLLLKKKEHKQKVAGIFPFKKITVLQNNR